ncbi:hypothetical protein ACLOJK_013652 [Asimina triloba]
MLIGRSGSTALTCRIVNYYLAEKKGNSGGTAPSLAGSLFCLLSCDEQSCVLSNSQTIEVDDEYFEDDYNFLKILSTKTDRCKQNQNALFAPHACEIFRRLLYRLPGKDDRFRWPSNKKRRWLFVASIDIYGGV